MTWFPSSRFRRATVGAIAGVAFATSAHAQVLVTEPGGGDTAWYTVGLSAQPRPVADLAHAIDVPAGACSGPAAPCFVVVVDGGQPKSPGQGTEWTGRIAFATLDAQGRAVADPKVGVLTGTGIASPRVQNGVIVDDVRFRLFNEHPYPVKVNLWAQLAPSGLQTTLPDYYGYYGVSPSFMPFTGRIATTNPDVWWAGPPYVRQSIHLNASLITVAPNLPGPLEFTYARRDRNVPQGGGWIREPTTVGSARLVNGHSGRCLSLPNTHEFGPNTWRLSIADCNVAPTQAWYVANGGGDQRFITGGVYGVCLDVDGGTRAYGASATGAECQPRDSQRWRVVPFGNEGDVRLVNVNSGFCLDVAGHATAAGSPVTQGTCTTHPSQRWRIDGTQY